MHSYLTNTCRIIFEILNHLINKVLEQKKMQSKDDFYQKEVINLKEYTVTDFQEKLYWIYQYGLIHEYAQYNIKEIWKVFFC